jgi:hypothetical protein
MTNSEIINKLDKSKIEEELVYTYKVVLGDEDTVILESTNLYDKESFKELVKKYKYKDKKKKEKRSPKKIIKQIIKNEDFELYEEEFTDTFKIK